VLRAGLLLVGLAYLASYIGVAVARMRAPFDLEWLEGGSVANVREVMLGHQIYQRPSLHFMPFIYTPLYYYVSAAVSHVLGLGYFPLRLVSFVASLAAFATIAWWVAKETGDRWAGAMAACLFAACFRIGGAWFDLARVDSLFMALLLAGLAVGRFVRSPKGAAGAAVLLTLAMLTKQEAIVPALAVAPFLWRTQRRLGVVFLGAFGAGLALSTIVLQWASSGWYLAYVVGLPASHKLLGTEAVGFWTADVAPVSAALLLGATGLAVLVRRRRSEVPSTEPTSEPPAPSIEPVASAEVTGVPSGPSAAWFYVPVLGALAAVAWVGRLHSGGYDNVLLPGYAAAAILCGIGLSVWCPRPGPRAGVTRAAPGRRAAPFLAGLVMLAQLALLAYDPIAQVPTAADHRAAARLVTQLHELHGTVYLPGHPWYLVLAGKKPSAQSAAVADVLRGPVGPARRSLQRALDLAIADQRFDNVVTDSMPWLNYLPKAFTRYYRRDHRIAAPGRALLSRTGIPTRPLDVWVPRAGVGRHTDRAD